jgi:hypothetical protein
MGENENEGVAFIPRLEMLQPIQRLEIMQINPTIENNQATIVPAH